MLNSIRKTVLARGLLETKEDGLGMQSEVGFQSRDAVSASLGAVL